MASVSSLMSVSKPTFSSSEKQPQTPISSSAVRSESVDEQTLHEQDEIIKEEREATQTAIHDPESKDDDFPGDRGTLRTWLLIVGVSDPHVQR